MLADKEHGERKSDVVPGFVEGLFFSGFVVFSLLAGLGYGQGFMYFRDIGRNETVQKL